MAVNTTKYGLQKVFHIRGYDSDNRLALDLRKMTETTFENNQTTVYLDGGRANAHGTSFDHSKMARISGASAQIDEQLLAAQIGSDTATLTNTTEIEYEDIITVTTADQANTAYTATGTANAEIGFVYLLNSDGSVQTTFTQAAAVGAGEFTYTAGTKALAFNSTEAPVGSVLKVIYKPTTATAKRWTNSTQSFSRTLRIVADVLFKDACTDELVQGQLVAEKGKIMGEFTWNVTSDGGPAVHDFSCEFLETCVTEKLWDWYVYDQDDLS